jgi:hypothetical protein
VYVRKLLPRKMAKYWLQRYSLFSRFDMGAQMDVQVGLAAAKPCISSCSSLESRDLALGRAEQQRV